MRYVAREHQVGQKEGIVWVVWDSLLKQPVQLFDGKRMAQYVATKLNKEAISQ